jgi:PAS domain S-box-containing protein
MGHVILLNVDGNRRTRAARSRVLESAGFRVVEAAGGRDALDSIRRHRDDPALVLLRGSLPDLEAAEFCRDVREGAAAPVFVLRLSGSKEPVSGADAPFSMDACIRDNYLQPEWLSAIEAFAGFLERQAADRRCIESLQAELSEQERAVDRLRRERDERLHAATEAAEVGTWWVDLEAGVESRDANVNRILGLPAEPSTMPVIAGSERIPPEDRPRIEAAFRRLTSEGGVYDEEFRILLPDGAVRWVRDRGRILTDAGGKPIYATGTLTDITERKHAEKELLRQKEILQTVFENIPVMIDFVDAAGRLQFVNRCWTETLGWSLDEAGERDLFAEFYPDPGYRAQVMDYIHNPRPGFIDFEVRTRDGRLLHTSWANVLLSDGTSIGIGVDITERKQAEEALRFERALLDALQTAAPVGMGFVNRDFRYIRVNQALAEITGVPAGHHIGRSVEEIVPDFWPVLQTVYRRVLEKGEVVANIELAGETRAQPGIKRYWLANGYPLKVNGEIVAAGIVVQDITGRKRAEEALRESERRLELALMGADLGSWDWDVRTGAVVLDDRWANLLGHAPHETVLNFDRWAQRLHPDDRERVREALNAHLQGEAPFYEAEYRLSSGADQWKWVLARGKVLERDPNGKPLHAAGIYRDISDRKVLEERLQKQQKKLLHAQRLTTVGELAAMVAHELNQPLGAITNYLGGASLRFHEALAANPELDEVIREALRLARRAAEVVKGIRDLVRRHDQHRECLSIHGLVSDSLLLARAEMHRRHIRLVFEVPADLPPIFGQRVHLQQLVLNLILNAMEAMESCAPDRRVLRLGAGLAGAGEIELSVSDSGVGFSDELAAHLVEPFVSTKPEGIGLGLSICRSIAEAHGGRISASSTPGRGATFRVWLPIAPADSR